MDLKYRHVFESEVEVAARAYFDSYHFGGETPAYGTVNLILFSRGLVKGLEFSGGLYNLFDAQYADPMSDGYRQEFLEQDGRTFRLKLTYRF